MLELNETNIQKILDEQINPQLALHNGGAKLVEVDKDKNSISINLVGGCAGCPSAQLTLYNGIVPILQESFPELEIILV